MAGATDQIPTRPHYPSVDRCHHPPSRTFAPMLLGAALLSACFEDSPDMWDDAMDASSEDGESGESIEEYGPPCGDQAPDTSRDPSTGQCYRISADWVTWPVAQATCVAQGGVLAVVSTVEEHVFVSQILQEGPGGEEPVYEAWIGLSRDALGEPFEWVDGQPLEAAQWQPGDPNEPDDAACVYAAEVDEWRWHDAPCDNPQPYICEWTPEPAPQ